MPVDLEESEIENESQVTPKHSEGEVECMKRLRQNQDQIFLTS